jgi:hypothetical protein
MQRDGKTPERGTQVQACGRSVKGIRIGFDRQHAQRRGAGDQFPGRVQRFQMNDVPLPVRSDTTARKREGAISRGMVQVDGNVGVVKVQIRELARDLAKQAGLPVRLAYARRQDRRRTAEQVTPFFTGKLQLHGLVAQSLPQRT